MMIRRANEQFRETQLLIRSAVEGLNQEQEQEADSYLHNSRRTLPQMLERAISNDVFYPVYLSLKLAKKSEHYEKIYYQYIVANAVLNRVAYYVLDLMEQHGVDVMPLKGLHFAHFYYPDIRMRFGLDVDFLFKSTKAKALAEKMLFGEGFRAGFSSPFQVNFKKRISRFSVHCETHLSPPTLMDAYQYPLWHDVWEHSTLCSMAGFRVRLMRPEDSLLVCCTSTLSRGTFSARDFLDLRQIIRLHNINWEIIIEAAKIPIWRHILFFPLQILQTLGDTVLSERLVPDFVLAALVGSTRPNLVLPKTSDRLIVGMRMPIDYRDILGLVGYTRTPLFKSFLSWTGGCKPRPINKAARVLLEAGHIPLFVRREFGNYYAAICLRSWLSSYLLKWKRNMPHKLNA